MTGCGQTTEETTKEYKEYYSELKATVESLKTENFIPYAAMLSMAENGDIQGRYKWYPFCEKTVSKLDIIIEKYKKKSIKNEELEKDHEDFIKELEMIRESYADFAHSCNYTIPPLTPGAVQKAKKKFELGIDGMSGTKLKISIQAGVWEEKLKDEKGGNVEKSKNDTGLDKNKDIISQTKDNTESTVKAKQENNFKVNNNDKLSLGGVSLNNTESEIKEILGTPSSVTSKDSGVSVLKYKDVEVHIANGQVQMLVSNSPNAQTSRGFMNNPVSMMLLKCTVELMKHQSMEIMT